ncbi:hypothetical protein TNCV_3273131 [Trichonephila clavipes]|nr:hypothetical protein TNCV_3273131 [Trichonephila clavipes]
MAPHRPRKAAPTEITTDDEDMIPYDVKEEEHPPNKFTNKEDPLNFPKGYLRSISSQIFSNSRGRSSAFPGSYSRLPIISQRGSIGEKSGELAGQGSA